MAQAVRIPVTVKMRAGWNDVSRNALELARMVQDAGAAAVTIHGRTAEQSYSGAADWDLVARVADSLRIPVFGSGDCVEPEQILERMGAGVSGVLVGRGVLRNPWILAQAADMSAGRAPRTVSLQERGEFLLAYIDLLLHERIAEPAGFRHVAPGQDPEPAGAPADPRTRDGRTRERWVINKLRALCSWYTKGLDGGSALRVRVNSAESLSHLRQIIGESFACTSSQRIPDEVLSSVR
jgi:tRNA-dihydrouridine synthase B